MNIGLLISELEDKDVKKICVGAVQAANDKEITLVIMPGKYLINEVAEDEENPYDYQYSAIFDYANTSDLDALIIDIERIGKKTTILKKEAFLKKFDKIPVLTLTEQEGFLNVNKPETDHEQFEQLGYEAVCDAIFYVKNQVLPPIEAAHTFSYEEKPSIQALSILSDIGNSILHRKYESEKAYEVFTHLACKKGIRNCGVLLYDTKVTNTLKYSWSRPEIITLKSGVMDGRELSFSSDDMHISSDKIISTFTQSKSKVLLMGTIYVGKYQLGVLVSEYDPGILIDHFFDNIISMVTAISRLSYLEKKLKKTTEELYEVQEELARDDSVLDHIGDQDYLTGGLNRRGFFAKAYDLLKDKFKPGNYAVVAYIHMDSLKRINELYGKDEGDRAVKRVAGILEEVFEGSIVGRIRGDEFAAIGITDDDGKAEALKLEMSAQNAKLLSDSTRYINHLQYSICEFDYEEDLSLREMLKETDEALQRIKGSI